MKINYRNRCADLDPPSRASSDSAGFDLRAALEESLILEPGERAIVPSGITIAIPSGYEGQVRPRSGLAAKHGVTVLNAPGTIDSDYRGEIGVILINHGSEPFRINRGDRIAQLVIAAVSPSELELADELDPTTRGSGGFGSSGT